MTNAKTRPARSRRLFAAVGAAALIGALSPIGPALSPVGGPISAAHAAGDVCDLCSISFDLTACEQLGGWPYNSTLESPPPAISGGQPAPAQPAPAQPAPAQPAPAQPAPAQPAPAQPVTGGSSGGSAGSSSGGTTTGTEPAVVAATVPGAPASLAHSVDGRVLTLTWAAAADGGSPLTGYKLVLNDGAPIDIPADATEYELTLGAGTYDAVLLATNELGDSEPTAVVTGIEIDAETPTPRAEKTLAADDAVAASNDSGASPLLGAGVLGVLVVAAGGLLAWWWVRRRNAAPAVATATAGDADAHDAASHDATA